MKCSLDSCESCDQGRRCSASCEITSALFSRLMLHQGDGGHEFRGGVVFPIEQKPAPKPPRMPAPVRRLLWARFLLILLVAVLAAAVQVF
jgi:hypothetical protein